MSFEPCPILLLDGGLGTSLEGPPHNVKFSSSTPLWSSHLLTTSPDTILAVQKDFAQAGADVILTATYQASYEGFAATKVADEQETEGEHGMLKSGYGREESMRYMQKAVSISKEALLSTSFPDGENLVALSLGAFGACMRPSQDFTGKYEPESFQTVQGLRDWHEDRLAAFTSSPETWAMIDLVAFETIPFLNEIHAAREVMKAVSASSPQNKNFYISCVFPNEDLQLPDGSSVEAVVRAMLQDERGEGLPKPWGVGINCTKVVKLEALVESFEAAYRKVTHEQGPAEATALQPWLVLYPDGAAGLVYNTSTSMWEGKEGTPTDARSWDERVFEIVEATRKRGVWGGLLVGGCCKTTPSDIARLRKRLDGHHIEPGSGITGLL